MRVFPAVLAAAAAVALVPALSGCGPILSTWSIVAAESELAAAKAAEAEQYAPYEFTASKEYLHKAHEEFGYADYEPAWVFASKAEQLARQGTERATTERHKHIDAPAVELRDETQPTSAASSSSSSSSSSPSSTTPRKVIIKKIEPTPPAGSAP